MHIKVLKLSNKVLFQSCQGIMDEHVSEGDIDHMVVLKISYF